MEENMIAEPNKNDEKDYLINLPVTTVLGESVTSKIRKIDSEIVKSAIDGNKKAFEELFMLTYGYVYCLAKRRLSHDDDIYDAIQETFTKVYQNLGRLSAPAAFISWLKTIAENTVTDILRKAPPESGEFFEEYTEVDENYNATRFDRDVKLDLTDILNDMSPDKVELLTRVFYDGMTVSDIAKMQGVPKTTIYSRLNVAKKELKELLNIRGIDKSMYGGSVVAMFATAVRNAIGTDLLSMAVAEEILHTVMTGDKKRAAVIVGVARKQRNEAARKIANKILFFCVAILLCLAILVYNLLGGRAIFGITPPNADNNDQNNTFFENLLGKDTSSDESSSNVTTSTESTSSEPSNSIDTSSEGTFSALSSNDSSTVSPPSTGDFKPDTPPTEDNVLGRQDANGFIATQRDWIYMSMGYTTKYNNKDDGLWKVKKDGSGLTKLSETNAFQINVVGDYIYFINPEGCIITKMRTDGSESTVLSDLYADNLVVVGKYAYFASYGKNGDGPRQQYYKMDLDTLETVVLIDDLKDYQKKVYWITPDKVFIIDSSEGTISRFYPETKKTELWYENAKMYGIVTGGYYVRDKIYDLETKREPIPFRESNEHAEAVEAFYYRHAGVEKIALKIHFNGSSGDSLGIFNLSDMSYSSHSYNFNGEHSPNMITASNIFDGYLYFIDEDGHVIRNSIEGNDFKIYN